MNFAESFLAAEDTSPKGSSSTNARSRRKFARTAPIALALLVAASIIVVNSANTKTEASASITVLRQQASALAIRVDTAQTKLDVLAEEYDQAHSRQATLEQQINADRGKISLAEQSVKRDNALLHTQAVNAYINSGAATDISAVLSSNPNALPAQRAYLGIALSRLDTAVASLTVSEHELTVRRQTLMNAQTQASAATLTLGQAENAASSIEGDLANTLHGVKGALAAAVASQEAQQAAQQAAATAATSTASAAGLATTAEGGVGALPVATSGSVSGGNPGSLAVSAAATQLGVPYQWAGASPGGGFDCSGLTMWAWSKAGVNLSHSAEAQYNEIEHVSMSQLQPGDLIFYASGGYIYHVIMYAGGGRAIQAIDSGTVIQYTPVWPGAIGAGRP